MASQTIVEQTVDQINADILMDMLDMYGEAAKISDPVAKAAKVGELREDAKQRAIKKIETQDKVVKSAKEAKDNARTAVQTLAHPLLMTAYTDGKVAAAIVKAVNNDPTIRSFNFLVNIFQQTDDEGKVTIQLSDPVTTLATVVPRKDANGNTGEPSIRKMEVEINGVWYLYGSSSQPAKEHALGFITVGKTAREDMQAALKQAGVNFRDPVSNSGATPVARKQHIVKGQVVAL